MPMDPRRLWAKSQPDGVAQTPSMLLPGHLADVYHAAGRVVDATADDQLAALGLDPGVYRDRFRRAVLLAAAVHDLGKANDHFQGMLLRSPDRHGRPQGVRHEWVTVLILRRLHDWLLPAVGGRDTDLALVEWAAAGHHPAPHHDSPPARTPDGAGVELRPLTTHADFVSILAWLGTTFGLAPPPAVPMPALTLGDGGDAIQEIGEWRRAAARVWKAIRHTPDARLAAAVKVTLVAADIAGSALPRGLAATPWAWITASFADRPRPGDLRAVAEFRLNGQPPRAFQEAVAASPARVTFVKAGCGSGKTLAAYLWAAANHPTRRLYFCYPTTGTATEGFRDYLFDDAAGEPRVGADLFHGRADVDFDLILNAGGGAAEDADKLDSLRAWHTPVVACTVDTVLGLVQNNRRGLYGWPALAQAAFVFDEVHAFDDRLFGALLRFLLDVPGVPVLLMTASLPKAREDALAPYLGGRPPVAGPADLEERPRYRKADAPGNDPLGPVAEALAAGRKVLWVCNIVGRVTAAAARLAGRDPLVYHSRFKYEDRVRRHADVIAAFKGGGPAVAVCSQVAEMSLDLSADLLVTDLAPVPALIQRLGRLNRRAGAGDPTRPVVVVEPDGPRPHLPYAPEDLAAARAWLAALPADGVSQRHLADAWEQTGDHPPDLIDSAWLDGGPATTVKELREGSPGITVLMAEDVPRVKARPKDLTRLVLPMPPRAGWEWWPRERGIPVAPPGEIAYDAKRGAEWRK